jgi:KDO2-lipid IV(A) lauroyltransferase
MAERTAKNLFEYALFLVFVFAARLLPRRAALALGGHIGRVCQFLIPKKRKLAYDNIRRAFPEMSASEVKVIVSATFRNLGISGMEMLTLNRFESEQDLQKNFDITGLEHLREAYDLNRGVFLLTGHIGFWEVGTFLVPKVGFPADFVAKKMKNPYVDKYFQRMREAGGGRCLDSKKGARRIIRSLGEKRGVAILLDQHISRNEAVVVDFFGRKACTTPIIAQIAMKYGIPVVPLFSYRTRDYRHNIVIEPMVLFPDESGEEAVVRNTALLTAKIEEAVRRDPTQWFWVHRRWRNLG